MKTVAQHPQFKAGERGTPDFALLKMIKPAPALPPTLFAARPAAVGDRLIIVGYGLAAEDDRWTFGTARMTTLTVNRLYNNMMELIDRAAIGETARSEAARAISADRLSPCAAARRCWSGSSRPVAAAGRPGPRRWRNTMTGSWRRRSNWARGSGRDLAISLQG